MTDSIYVRARMGITLFAMIAFTAGVARAQWPTDPSVNLAIADRSGSQQIPLVGSTSDGGTYVAWFDNTAGSYQVYLQRLSAAGVEQWPHNGILVSGHPQDTALFGWDMIVDSADNAVIVFSDIRDGGDLDTFAYKVGPTGQMLWGADGVQLSINNGFDPAPRVAEAANGDFVFVWQRDPSLGDADIRMQRLTAAGTPLLAVGGLAVVASAGEDPGFVQIVPAENGNVILTWLRNIRSLSSPRHIRARKFSPTGSPLWAGSVEVFGAFSIPIGYFPSMLADGAGGAVIAWHRSDGSLYNSFVQHLDSSGAELFPHDGIAVSTTPGMYHIGPALAYDKTSGESFIFWNEENSLQSQWGIYGQKFSPTGVRAWGDGGVALMPVNTVYKSIPRTVPYAGGAMVFLLDQTGGFGTDRLLGMRVDGQGNQVWPGGQVVISSLPSSKARYPVTMASSGVATLVWEDDRRGTVDVFGQNVGPSGVLGNAGLPGSVSASLRVTKSTVTAGNLTLSWDASCSPDAVSYAIYEGSLGDFTSHVKKDCSDDGGDRVEEISPPSEDSYYLLVALTGTNEGSYGKTSRGDERPTPPVGDRCLDSQILTACSP